MLSVFRQPAQDPREQSTVLLSRSQQGLCPPFTSLVLTASRRFCEHPVLLVLKNVCADGASLNDVLCGSSLGNWDSGLQCESLWKGSTVRGRRPLRINYHT